MDLFFLCWAFDNRWFFNIKNRCNEYIFTIPLVVNLFSLSWIIIQKQFHTKNHLPFFIQIIVLLALLSISNLYLIFIIQMNSTQKISNIKDNYVQIQKFYLQYQTKKVIWSFIGLMFTILAVCLTAVQSLYINRNHKTYDCISNKFRYYLDIVCYSYILLNIFVFFVFKGVYLLSAWVCCPAVYLKIKKIID